MTPRQLATIPGFPVRMAQSVAGGGWGAPETPAPVEVRVSVSGGLWVSNGLALWGVDAQIALPDGLGPLLDFAIGFGHGLLYDFGLLWSTGWEREGDYGRILTDGQRLYVSERHGPAVFELDPAGGDLLRTLLRSPDAGPPFLAGDRICAVYTDFDAGVRGIETMTPDGAISRVPLADFGALIPTIGFDQTLRGYAVNDGVVTRFTRSGDVERWGRVPAELAPAQLHVDAGGRVLYATTDPDGVTVFVLSDRLD